MLIVPASTTDRTRIFGKIACRYGFLKEEDFSASLMDLIALERQGRSADVGEVCMMRGLLTEDERRRLSIASAYYFGRREDELIGEIAVKHGFVSSVQVEEALALQEMLYQSGTGKVPRLLGILMDERALDTDQLLNLLKVIQRYVMRHRTLALEDASAEDSGIYDFRNARLEGDLSRQMPGRIPRASKRFQVTDGQVALNLMAAGAPARWDRGLLLDPGLARQSQSTGPLVNLSVSGLQALVPEAMDVEQSLRLSIHVPMLPQPLRTSGEVRWAEENDGQYRLGIKFTQLDAHAERFLKELEANPFLCSIGRSAFELTTTVH